MEWLSILALLACPLMMLFCMKGMFSGNKDHDDKGKMEQPQVSQQELQALQIKMADLMEQNHKLMKEIQSVKESKSTKEPASDMVEIIEEEKAKREIS